MVPYLGKNYINYGDFHTHTIYSMHGMSSPEEMVRAAEQAGLKYLAITDHHFPFKKADGYMDPMYFLRKNQEARMWEYGRSFGDCGVKVIPGYEYNLFVPEEMSNGFIKHPHLRLIGLHTWHCYVKETTPNTLIDEVYDRLRTGYYHILVHPERELSDLCYSEANHDFDIIGGSDYGIIRGSVTILRSMVQLCKTYRLAIELNESSLNSDIAGSFTKKGGNGNIGRALFWIREAMDAGIDIIVNTDSHVSGSVGKASMAFNLLEGVGFPVDHIINFDEDKIKHYILSKI